MKIAIHERPESFSDRWIAYCEHNNIEYKIVNCYDSNIISQLKDCAGLMWHWNHGDYREQNFARQLIYSLQNMEIKVFPDFNTCWHFDDKVGQKYLLETIGAPLVRSYVFYNKEDAIKWINETQFPKVFKLRGGAGSSNVELVKSKKEAIKLTRRAFGRGFSLSNKWAGLRQRFWVLRRDKNFKSVVHVLKGFVRLILQTPGINLLPIQKGYDYFQDFIPNNEYDDRIVVIGNRAIAIRRYNRKDDFRASGSGLLRHDKNLFNTKTIKIAFDVAAKLNTQSLAFDFIYDKNQNPLIVEVSYAYAQGPAYDNCPGYWDQDLIWHDDNVNPQKYIIEDFIKSIKSIKLNRCSLEN